MAVSQSRNLSFPSATRRRRSSKTSRCQASDGKSMAGGFRTAFAQTTLMRTRMSGGVGRAVSNGGPYPIYLFAVQTSQIRSH